MTSIWWIRGDVRLRDQPALQAAQRGGEVVPLFILDPSLLCQTPRRRQAFLFAALRALDSELLTRGARLVIRSGQPVEVLQRLMHEVKAQAVFAEMDYTPFARRRDELVARTLDLHLLEGRAVQSPTSVSKSDGSPYSVYTPYSRAWKKHLPERLPLHLAPERLEMPAAIHSEQLPELPRDDAFPASEAEAHRRLRDFTAERIYAYEGKRDRMALDGTSALSPYLRFGMLSMRAVVDAALRALSAAGSEPARHSAETWLNELIWREFYIQIMYHHPRVHATAFRTNFSGILWRNNSSEFEAWKAGLTGVPIVDAGMRQLSKTGWMHNRARMLAASYLVKDLLIDWRWGERWFMDQLIDGDPSSNNGGWQWIAGTGTDAAPYFRVFNPVLQSRKFDPDGHYIRRWVPELAGVRSEAIHAPWERGIVIAGYPRVPIVNHAAAVRRARLAYENAKDLAGFKGSEGQPVTHPSKISMPGAHAAN